MFDPTPSARDHPLIQCIEYDWSVVVRCPACGHKARWDADTMVNRFRDGLRATVGDVADRLKPHCKGYLPKVYTLQGAGMATWTEDKYGMSDNWTFRDVRLRQFLERHGLPMDLADERRAIAEAWRAEHT